MKKKFILSISVVMFVMTMAMTFYQNANAKVSSDLLLDNVEALSSPRESSRQWFVTYHQMGHDCYGYGYWCCPDYDC